MKVRLTQDAKVEQNQNLNTRESNVMFERNGLEPKWRETARHVFRGLIQRNQTRGAYKDDGFRRCPVPLSQCDNRGQ